MRWKQEWDREYRSTSEGERERERKRGWWEHGKRVNTNDVGRERGGWDKKVEDRFIDGIKTGAIRERPYEASGVGEEEHCIPYYLDGTLRVMCSAILVVNVNNMIHGPFQCKFDRFFLNAGG